MLRKREYDIIVVGGGAAGLAAAIGAKWAGASCLLIERNGSLGGQATNSNVASYCGFFTRGQKEPQQIVRGVGDEVLRELKALGFYDGYKLSPVRNAIIALDIEATKAAFDRLVEKYQLDCLLHCRLVEAIMDPSGENILGVRCVDDEGSCEFMGKAFVDATGDGNLGFLAGAPYRCGDGKGHSQMTSRVMRIDRVDPSVKFTPANIEKAILQAKADGFKHLTKESGIVFRVCDDTVAAILPSVEIPALDAETLTACEMDTRRQCLDYIAAFRKYMPDIEHCRLIWTGNYLGPRDTRHLCAEYTLTGKDIVNAVKHEDGIARGAWPCERHVEKNKMAQYIFIKEDDYYEIPLRCLKVRKIKNLWAAGRVLDADPIAFASARVLGHRFCHGSCRRSGCRLYAARRRGCCQKCSGRTAPPERQNLTPILYREGKAHHEGQ